MKLGYDKHLYLLAFDHRASFSKDIFGVPEPVSPEIQNRITDTKMVIYEAFKQALSKGAPKEICGILVDERYGTAVAEKAIADHATLAMPVEKSGQVEFQFEFGDHYAEHIEKFDPDFCKILIRYNPEEDQASNQRQIESIAPLSDWLHEYDRKFLIELLVPATPDQLKGSGSQQSYDLNVRPELVVRTIRELQEGGIEPDIWKIEGLDRREDCERVVKQARAGGGRESVVCIVLGRGATLDQDRKWLSVAAPVDGFSGFAIGRTIWLGAINKYVGRQLTRDEARDEIRDRYMDMIETYSVHSRVADRKVA